MSNRPLESQKLESHWKSYRASAAAQTISRAENRQGTRKQPLLQRVEWPTLIVAAAIYFGFGAVTWFYDHLFWWMVLPLGAYLVAWHGSLQHEVIHGHPTSSALLNQLLVFPSLWLWIPFRLYRDSHLSHHENSRLTDPAFDPESYYLRAADWARQPALVQRLLTAQNTGLGRLVIGPALVTIRLFVSEASRLRNGDFGNLGAWLQHCLACALVFYWVVGLCGIPVWEYILLFVYPGLSLTLLRSFIEHRAAEPEGERTVIVESGPLFSLLFLNNNLHAVHHDAPGLPWYRIPAAWRARRDEILAANGSYYFDGYRQILRQYLFTAKEPVIHPYVV